jgi:hypothetical protein
MLEYYELLSSFAFKFNLRRYTKLGWYRVVYDDGDKEDLTIAGLKGIIGRTEVATPGLRGATTGRMKVVTPGLGVATGVGSKGPKRARAPTTPAPPRQKKTRLDETVGAAAGARAAGAYTCPLVGSTRAVFVTETTQRMPKTLLTLS